MSQSDAYNLHTKIWGMAVLKRSAEIEEEELEKERQAQQLTDQWAAILAQGQAEVRTEKETQKYQWSLKLLPDMESISNIDKVKYLKQPNTTFVGRATIKEIKEQCFKIYGIKPEF